MDVTVTDFEIQELRSNFFKHISKNGLSEADDFHSADISRIKTNGDWLRRFLLHTDNVQADALSMLLESCQWRKSFGVNDITEENINMAIVNEGSIFSHNRDKDGKALLIFKSKLHVKDKYEFDELKRVLVYWMERLEREESGEPISIFFDMGGAGLGNMDTDYTKYIINLFKCYYPQFLNNIYVYDMAWVLSAVFKLIKSWLPPKAVQKIKTVSKSNLKDYVSPEQALTCWGGTDDYQFEFVPEVKVPQPEVERKKVHFADRSPTEDHKSFSDATSPSPVPAYKLTITPADIIQFASDAGDTSAAVKLTNDDACPISFKIKTTSPEKFRVRPSAGQLSPGKHATIQVVLQPGYEGPGIQRDKFMILAVPVTPDLVNKDPADLWKVSGNIMQHRLRCSLPAATTTENPRNGSVPDSDRQLTKLSNEMSKLHNELHSVADEVRRMQIQQWILLLLVILLTAMTVYLVKQDPISAPPDGTCSQQSHYPPLP